MSNKDAVSLPSDAEAPPASPSPLETSLQVSSEPKQSTSSPTEPKHDSPPSSALVLLGLFGLHKVFYLCLIFFSFSMMPPIFDMHQYLGNYHYPLTESPNLSSLFKTWDASHYLRLSDEGYQVGTMSTAFPPLWPMSIRAVHQMTFLPHFYAGMLASFFFSILGFFLFFRMVYAEFGKEVAELSTLFLLAYPGALFFQFPYTESLFLCWVMLFFLALRARRYVWVVLLAMLIVLTRVVGVFLIFPLLYHLLVLYREKASEKRGAWLALSGPFLGYAAYLLFMRWATGSFFEAAAAQQRFIAQPSVAKLFDIWGFLQSTFRVNHVHHFLGSLLDRLWFLFFLIVFVWMLRKKMWLYASFAFPMGFLPAILTSYMSYTRYLSTVFPVFIACGVFFAPNHRRVGRWWVLAVFLSVQYILLIRHINCIWAG